MSPADASAATASPSSLEQSATRGEAPRALTVLGLVFLLYLPLAFLGYGTDGDMYAVVETGRQLVATGEYAPSRVPGYPVHEFAVAALDALGGSALSNLGTLAMFLLALWAFLRIAAHFGVPHLRWLVALMVVHPLFWANATSTADFFWALALILCGMLAGLRGRYLLAGVLFGLAIGARFTSPLAIAGILLYFLLTRWEERWHWVAGGALMTAVAFACFVPSFSRAGWTVAGLGPVGEGAERYWGFYRTVGRYLFKNVDFWGPPACLLLPVLGWRAWRGRFSLPNPRWRPLLWLCLYEIVAYQLLFLYYPFKTEYLIPSLPFFLLGAAMLLPSSRNLFAVLTLLVASVNLVSFQFARPNVPHRATSAELGFWIEPGYAAREISARLRSMHCDTRRCFAQDRGEPM